MAEGNKPEHARRRETRGRQAKEESPAGKRETGGKPAGDRRPCGEAPNHPVRVRGFGAARIYDVAGGANGAKSSSLLAGNASVSRAPRRLHHPDRKPQSTPLIMTARVSA